jgi:hypothetical protein
VNGDGYADLVVTASWTNDERGSGDVASNDGRVYVYLGGPSGIPDRPATEIEGPGTFAFGSEAASAGDVNGDGFSDLVLGAFGDGHTADVAGNAFVYLGGPDGLAASPATELDGTDPAGFFGLVASSPGDFDGDGFSDVAIGAYEALDAAGRVHVFAGSEAGIPTTSALTLTGPAQSNFGSEIALYSVSSGGARKSGGRAPALFSSAMSGSFRASPPSLLRKRGIGATSRGASPPRSRTLAS